MQIRIDYRERESGLAELLSEAGFSVEIRRLHHGDYQINRILTIERKTARDLLISIIDGRLFRQASNLKRYCRRPLLLVEGNPFETGIPMDPLAVRGALVSVQVIWHIPVLCASSREETRDLFLLMGRQTEKVSEEVIVRGGYRPRRLFSKQLFLLQGLPRVGPTLARRLLDHFGSVARVMSASAGELTAVNGIGKDAARIIREVLDAHPDPVRTLYRSAGNRPDSH